MSKSFNLYWFEKPIKIAGIELLENTKKSADQLHAVTSIKPIGCKKELLVAVGRSARKLRCARFAPVSEGDCIRFEDKAGKAFSVVNSSAGFSFKISPIFSEWHQLRLGKLKYDLQCKEIETDEELAQWHDLEQFHYRTHSDILGQDLAGQETKGSGGRRAVLIAKVNINKKQYTMGFIELAMPLLMVGSRKLIFDRPFTDEKMQIVWEKWDKGAISKHANRICRISRVVVDPSFRGISITDYLISSAIKYAKERWNIGGLPPAFMEISAEMLNYVDFVSKAGFVLVGMTEGNRSRLAKDMKAIHDGQKNNSGIMSLQHKYYANLKAYAAKSDWSIEQAINWLEEVTKDNIYLEHDGLTYEEQAFLRSVIRSPIPYFLLGLSESASAYLKEGASALKAKPKFKPTWQKANSPRINISSLEVKADIDTSSSDESTYVKLAFGLTGSSINQRLFSINNFKAASGNIIFVDGFSGTGKTLFLDFLLDRLPPNVTSTFFGNIKGKAASLGLVDTSETLIDYFGKRFGFEASLRMLSQFGLADATALLRPIWALSQGQRYRVRLAEMASGEADIWVVDEYCAELDTVTAQIISHKLRRIVRDTGVILIAAAANNNHFLDALCPDYLVSFSSGVKTEVFPFRGR